MKVRFRGARKSSKTRKMSVYVESWEQDAVCLAVSSPRRGMTMITYLRPGNESMGLRPIGRMDMAVMLVVGVHGRVGAPRATFAEGTKNVAAIGDEASPRQEIRPAPANRIRVYGQSPKQGKERWRH